MDCLISYKGHNIPGKKRADGKPLEDGTRKVSDAIVDSSFWYREVYNHTATCDKCNSEEILKAYLARRMCTKFLFQTSPLLVKLALKYEKLSKDRGHPLEKGLVDEFILKSNSGIVSKYEDRIPFERLKEFVRREEDRADAANTSYKPASKKMKSLAHIFEIHGRDFFRTMDESKFQDFETVIEVHTL